MSFKNDKNYAKNTYIKRAAAFVLILACVLGMCVGAFAAGSIYVNGSTGVLGSDLDSAYAIGGSGVSGISGSSVYAITADGIELVEGGSGDGKPSNGSEIDPEDIEIEHLNVSGNIELPATTMRVGLYFYHTTESRDTSLLSANLQNYVGSGYELGYYDDDRKFVSIDAVLDQEKITMLKDKNMYYYAAANSYYEGEGSIQVGCYHVRLPDMYDTYEEALDALYGIDDDVFVKYTEDGFAAMVGNYTSYDQAESAAQWLDLGDYTIDSGTSYTVTIVETGTSDILFEYDCGGETWLAVHPLGDGEKAETWFKGYRYYGDFEYQRNGDDRNITVVSVVDIEDYVKGVLPYELSDSWPLEALKAQAVCARTYALRSLNSYSSVGFDVTNDTYSQVYRGTLNAGSNTDQAVEETEGVCAVYNGKLCYTLFSSSCGGGTESNENVNGTAFDYLIGVIDPFEAEIEDMIRNYRWTYKMTPAKLTSQLKRYSLSTVKSVEPTYSDTNNVIELLVTDKNGKTATVSRDACRTSLGLPSIHYTVEWSSSDQAFVFEGAGLGHNVGMSQYGAYSMAENFGFTYDQILSFYFTGISLKTGIAR